MKIDEEAKQPRAGATDESTTTDVCSALSCDDVTGCGPRRVRARRERAKRTDRNGGRVRMPRPACFQQADG